ncbi:hypothetical protein [Legionella hackeliae]|uniref:Uncharacterized protein n=1 Tax=Legionella hackeliae TaxID=449 RepID=A0A0A8URM5_LEGHA|nr:hypothetical protein [Legionella hackeliae]KTD15238.1 hypothetical protein Lhac_0080 [Legionella hackeliae]CEK11398.1 protein of unknown function [Legionella hackeliae]STX48169.1 Uncharacterised protein [Legionella hackeliae]
MKARNETSQKQKEKKVQDTNQHIQVLFKNKQLIEGQEVQVLADFSDFITSHYNPAIHKIYDGYQCQLENIAKIEDINADICLSVLESKAKARISFLKAAEDALKTYKDILTSSKSIYIPKDKIPQDNLKKYLETDARWIDSLYNQVQDASGVGGITTNLANYWNHYTALFGPSSFDFDLGELVNQINQKLQQIADELKIEIQKQTVVSELHKDKIDLYALHQRYQEVKRLQAAEAELKSTKDDFEQRKAEAILCSRLISIFHEQAILEANFSNFDCKLLEIEEMATQTLDEITQSLVTMNGKDALEYLQLEQDRLASIDVKKLLEVSTDYRDPSGAQLKTISTYQLEAIIKKWNDLPGFFAPIKVIPEVINSLNLQATEHLNIIQKQNLTLRQAEQTLIDSIAARKTIILSLQKLAEIQFNVTQLLKRSPTTQEEKKVLVLEIELTQAKITDLMGQLESNKNDAVKAKIEATEPLIKELARVKTALQIELLTHTESEYSRLFASIDLENANRSSRTQISQQMRIFENYLEETIEICVHTQDKVVLEKLILANKRLDAIRHKMQVVIPLLDQVDDISERYAMLLNEAGNLPPDSLKPALELFKKAAMLEASSSEVLGKAKLLLSKEKLISIEEAQVNLNGLKEKYVKLYTDNPLVLLNEVDVNFKLLVERLKLLEKPQYRYHEKSKQQLYREIVALEKSELFSAWQRLDKSTLGAIEQEKSQSIQKLQGNLAFFKTLHEPQSPLSIGLFGQENRPAEQKEKFSHIRHSLMSKYFGADDQLSGFFGSYLKERAKEFWFQDLISSYIALGLKCFHWKTDAQQRQEYLQNLKTAFQNYKNDSSHYEQLLEVVDEGKKFMPRGRIRGSHDKTLQFHLNAFKEEIRTIHEENTDVYTAEEISAVK